MKKPTKKPANDNKFAGLSNTEIVLVYYRLKQYVNMIDSNLDNGYATKVIKSPVGMTTSLKEVSKEKIQVFKDSLYYKTMKDALDKLEKVSSLIEECDQDVISIIQQIK